MRPGWLRVPSLPRGRRCPRQPVNLPGARLPLSSGQSLFIPDYDPPREVIVTRPQQGFTPVHPAPAFPSPVTPDGTGSSGLSPGFAPRRAGPGGARQGGDRLGHCLDCVPGISQPPSTYSLTTCDLASHDYPILEVLRPWPANFRRTRWLGAGGCRAYEPVCRTRRTVCFRPWSVWVHAGCGRAGRGGDRLRWSAVMLRPGRRTGRS